MCHVKRCSEAFVSKPAQRRRGPFLCLAAQARENKPPLTKWVMNTEVQIQSKTRHTYYQDPRSYTSYNK